MSDSIPIPKLIRSDQLGHSRTPEKRDVPADLRWSRVEEFLRSCELSANTRKAYKRELQKFLSWTDKPWQDITHRNINHYKEVVF